MPPAWRIGADQSYAGYEPSGRDAGQCCAGAFPVRWPWCSIPRGQRTCPAAWLPSEVGFAQYDARLSSYLQSMAALGYDPLVAIQTALDGHAVDVLEQHYGPIPIKA